MAARAQTVSRESSCEMRLRWRRHSPEYQREDGKKSRLRQDSGAQEKDQDGNRGSDGTVRAHPRPGSVGLR